jgi:hypothetical protein
MDLQGYWKFHRRMFSHPVWKRPMATRLVWITILGHVNHQDNDWLFGTERITIPSGTFITSQDHLAKLSGVSRKQVRTAIRDLIALDSIRANQRANRYTEITVIKWCLYNGTSKDEGQPKGRVRANRGPTEGHDGIREEGKKNTSGQNHNGFERFWAEYPKKVGKIQATKEWEILHPTEELAFTILQAIIQQKETVKSMIDRDMHHILDPERWIKYRRWEDEIPAIRKQYELPEME